MACRAFPSTIPEIFLIWAIPSQQLASVSVMHCTQWSFSLPRVSEFNKLVESTEGYCLDILIRRCITQISGEWLLFWPHGAKHTSAHTHSDEWLLPPQIQLPPAPCCCHGGYYTRECQHLPSTACPASERTLPTRSMEWWSAPPMRLKPHGRPPVSVISWRPAISRLFLLGALYGKWKLAQSSAQRILMSCNDCHRKLT